MTNVRNNRLKRKVKIRKKIFGTVNRPRLVVFRSNKHIYAEIINDNNGTVVVEHSDIKQKPEGNKIDVARKIGSDIAEKALSKNIKTIVFDRGGYRYHGRVKALAEGARSKGLIF